MKRAYYSDSLSGFVATRAQAICDRLAGESAACGFPALASQLEAWKREVEHLQSILGRYQGSLFLEFSIPRMGRRADVVLRIDPVIFVLEFKVGESRFTTAAEEQVWDYALDLKNFHETSHDEYVVPVLVVTEGRGPDPVVRFADKTCPPLKAGLEDLPALLDRVLHTVGSGARIPSDQWESGRYCPTPTIIEAARSLFRGHGVEEIWRNDAGGENLERTSQVLTDIIRRSRERSEKAICFVTGVPGAGKTLVGLRTAAQFKDKTDAHHSVYLSGNGPLVRVLSEALARDRVHQAAELGTVLRLPLVRSEVKAFLQNVHHFRDECLKDPGPPHEHVAIFDEAQRAWDAAQTIDFMKRKKNQPGFRQSEPEYLISCMNRHRDWSVVIALVGGGQEINTGEAGIGEWVAALNRSFPDWRVYISSRLADREYAAGEALQQLSGRSHVTLCEELHLATSMRSFRAENVSEFVKELLDLDGTKARDALSRALRTYPMVITRRMEAAKRWMRDRARGSERYGIVVSSQAERLRPYAISVKSPVDPVHWFLYGKEDVRSSYFLEDVATEFHVQGLELDWTCVAWDADLRFSEDGWQHWSFRGDRWNRIHKEHRRRYQKNAYRVLLTRARQGMIIVVPEGDPSDHTRLPEFYDPTYDYLKGVGFPEI